MSYPGGDWIPPNDGGFGDSEGPQERPPLASLGTFNSEGKLVAMSHEQRARNLNQLSPPGFGALPQAPFWFGEERQKNIVAKVLAMHAAALQRPLTTDEADALAYHRSRSCKLLAWRSPVLLMSTAYFVYRGRASFKFPFYTPKPASFNPYCFPSRTRPFVTGPMAHAIWHAVRFGAYGTLLGLVVTPLFISYAETSYVVHILNDPRLKSIRDHARQQQQQQQQQQQGNQARSRASGPPRRASTDEDTSTDEATPSSQSYVLEQQQPQPRHQPLQWTERPPKTPTTPQDDDSFLFDNASPVAPSARQQHQSSSTQLPAGGGGGGGGGSAWDRLRQRAKSGQDVWEQAGQSREDSRNQRLDQHAYDQSDREKTRAKEQAQKEFDAMLERERRGQGESGGRG
ncbi:hypothetical protein MMYC01_202722 [Madurella mycetomatis]|uniref:Uncharacterized protein n=1 Tax=Madurella mycetomatis TaxID=100816 RepID=A0A175WDG8_9PEZI|nr:hypothetical protein MMYC01_202722 [Madurella mycetomatis]